MRQANKLGGHRSLGERSESVNLCPVSHIIRDEIRQSFSGRDSSNIKRVLSACVSSFSRMISRANKLRIYNTNRAFAF